MNLRALNTSETSDTSDNVEELRRQIESALGSVEEIVKKKAVISVGTTPDQPAAGQNSDQDEVVVYVSIKINKNQEREGEVEGQHRNGDTASNGVNGGSPASNGELEAERSGRRRKVRTEDCEVTGQAIQPRRRGRGAGRLGRSSTAPSTPVRTRAAIMRSNNSLEQTKSLEVRQSDITTQHYWPHCQSAVTNIDKLFPMKVHRNFRPTHLRC